ncbi:MAG: FecCD family ABC transporter permease [Ruminococcus sp.]
MNSEKLISVSEKKREEKDQLYMKNLRRSRLFLLILAAVLLVSMILSLWAGSYDTPVKELFLGIFGKASDDKINIVVQNVRLPRICTAAAAGAGLGITGCILQAVLENPLASASTLGVSQGAGFGAAFAIIILGAGRSGSGAGISLCAFIGSMAVAAVIFALSKFRQVSSESIVLAGVAISSMFTGATTLLQYFADEVELTALVFWTFGDLGSTSWKEIRFMSVVVLAAFLYFLFHRWDYNALLGGAETAHSLGIRVRRLIIVNMLVCCFTAAAIVSYIGLINFIGLAAPHIVRMAVGNNHVYLIPGSLLGGAILLLLADLLARTVISPVILPIGAVTSFLGAPLFLYLLFKGGKKKC